MGRSEEVLSSRLRINSVLSTFSVLTALQDANSWKQPRHTEDICSAEQLYMLNPIDPTASHLKHGFLKTLNDQHDQTL